MRFRWSYYYEDLQHERSKQQQQQQHSEPQPGPSTSTSTSTSTPPPAEIPYLVYPSYSGDIPALDYHAARAASAASTTHDLHRIARDEANYAAQQIRNQRALAKQHPHSNSDSFAPHDLLPQLHGPPLPHAPNTLSLRQQEAAARTRAANVVRLGSGITPAGWAPPPPSSPQHDLSSFSFFPVSDTAPQKPSKPVGASMAQRMAALGSIYSLGIVALDQEGQRRQFARADGVATDDWVLTNSAFSSWFPPPYRVLSLVALGILVFAADIAILNKLGIDPVPLLFPNRRATTRTAGGRRRRAASLPLRRAQGLGQGIGLGAGLTTPTQLTRALLLLGAVYAALALGGWASFRTYVDASWLHGDPSGRHAQALQGLAVGAALGLACWPGNFLLRELRWAFWSGLGRLLWPSSEVVGVPIVGARVSPLMRNGAAGEDERPMSAAEMARFEGEEEQEDEHEDEDARELLTTTTSPSRPSPSPLSNKFHLALHKLRLALRDTRRWSLPTPFSAVILADVLTSFAKVFADVWLTACFLVPRKEHHTWWNGRGSVVVPILTSLPYLIRLRQCISEYISTSPSRKHNQHNNNQHNNNQHKPRSRRPLFNALKYFSALPVIWLAALEGFASSELAAWEAGMGAEGRVDVLGGGVGVQWVGVGKGIQVVRWDMWAWGEEARWRQRMIWRCWLFWVFFNSIFSFWWDVTYDWGLDIFRLRTVSRIISSSPDPSPATHTHTHTHRRALSSVVLRPPQTPLLFPEWAYHLTIILDLILRFTWSIKLSSQLFRYADWEGGVFLLEAGEIVRRGAWVVLRFEHAALGAWGAGLFGGGRGGGGGGGTTTAGTTGQPFTTRVGLGGEEGGGYVDEDGGEDDVGAEDGKAKVRWAV